METPPIYRIEVLGTVGTNEYVFAYEDVLTSAGNTVTANFRDLPKEYFAENVTNRRVRAWYAASGLGPVYTYGDTRAGRRCTRYAADLQRGGRSAAGQDHLQPCSWPCD